MPGSTSRLYFLRIYQVWGVLQFGESVPGTREDHTGLTNCTPRVSGTCCSLLLKFTPKVEWTRKRVLN